MRPGPNPFIKPLLTEEMIQRILGPGLDGSPSEAGYEEAMNTLAEYQRLRNACSGLMHIIVSEFPELEGRNIIEAGLEVKARIKQLREAHVSAERELQSTRESLQQKLQNARAETTLAHRREISEAIGIAIDTEPGTIAQQVARLFKEARNAG